MPGNRWRRRTMPALEDHGSQESSTTSVLLPRRKRREATTRKCNRSSSRPFHSIRQRLPDPFSLSPRLLSANLSQYCVNSTGWLNSFFLLTAKYLSRSRWLHEQETQAVFNINSKAAPITGNNIFIFSSFSAFLSCIIYFSTLHIFLWPLFFTSQ